MSSSSRDKAPLQYLTPDKLYKQISTLTANMAVTKGAFEMHIERCTFEDMEWNHMDQMHRPCIHKTYKEGVRIAFGENFAISLTRWGDWPFFITVTDSYVARGLFYQSLTIAGIIFLHSIISLEKTNAGVKTKIEWYIASHKLLKFTHKWLDKKLYKLNVRLQEEDAQIRHGRFNLREKGYRFHTDQPNYYNSNSVRMNTLYPELHAGAFISIDDCQAEPIIKKIENLEFIIKKENDVYQIWPSACPHEGGPLIKGTFCNMQITCPWHGLRFSPVQLSQQAPQGARYGFEYHLVADKIYITNMAADFNKQEETQVAIDGFN